VTAVLLALSAFAAAQTPTERTQTDDYVIPPGVFKVGHGVLPPKATYSPTPKYPKDAKKEKIEGIVYVSCVVDETGVVKNPKVTQGLDKNFDVLALDAATKWKFKPATKDGQPVPVFLVIEIIFRFK
jgi:TonB family protein